jgi:beta-lactamase regulating signal transducer with metallopeptidase domain
MMQFLAEWVLRSSILIACGALLLAILRVKDSSVRLAGWTAMLAGSLLIPAMMVILPPLPIRIFRSQPPVAAHAVNTVAQSAPGSSVAFAESQIPTPPKAPPLDWMTALSFAYSLAAALMLLRLLTGLVVSLRLLHKTHPTDSAEFRESSCVNSPVTLGLIRPVIVLPLDWQQWESAKLRAVLAHESAHIRRRDPLMQFVSAIHRAMLWFSPLAWLLHSRIVAVAEEASDDAAVIEMSEPAVYAELLLDFMRLPTLRSSPVGIPMARYGRPDRRIQRILNAKSFSRGLTRWSIAGLLVIATPLTYSRRPRRPVHRPPRQSQRHPGPTVHNSMWRRSNCAIPMLRALAAAVGRAARTFAGIA